MASKYPQLAAWALLAGLPAVLLVLLFVVDSLNAHHASPAGHFYIVSAVAVIALLLAVPACVAALRLQSARTLLIALAFLSMAGLFAVHGLATPGFLVDRPASEQQLSGAQDGHGYYGDHGTLSSDRGAAADAAPGAYAGPSPYYAVVGVSARLSVLLAAIFLALSAVERPRCVCATVERNSAWVIGGWCAVLLGYAVVALRYPELLPARILSEQAFLDVTLAIVVVLTLFAGWRYAQGYRHSGLHMYAAISVGALLICWAQLAMHFGATWDRVWWLYHVQLLAAFLTMLWGLASEYARGRSMTETFERLALRDALAQVEAGYGEVIRALATSLEARDRYTHGHGQRVAALAFLIGREMGLSPERLRAVAQGALLHDVGKLSVPDSILLKPASLTAEEYRRIQEHPEAGERVLASTLPNATERAVVRHHHERFDGSGYPDGLAGEAIPLEARITAVADVYDAVRSTRAYREAWGRERAMTLIEEGVGTHFDPRCVEAFRRVVDRWELEFAEGEPDAAAAPQSAPSVLPAS